MEKLCLPNKSQEMQASYIKGLIQNSLFYGREAVRVYMHNSCKSNSEKKQNFPVANICLY